MKKSFLLSIAVYLAAGCNNASESVASKVDSAVKLAADSVKASADTIVRKLDSSLHAAADSAKLRIKAASDSLRKAAK
jgi:hypothetical protein